jgi:hypothetical protein
MYFFPNLPRITASRGEAGEACIGAVRNIKVRLKPFRSPLLRNDPTFAPFRRSPNRSINHPLSQLYSYLTHYPSPRISLMPTVKNFARRRTELWIEDGRGM